MNESNVGPMDPSYLPVFRRYITASRKLMSDAGLILKTDCYNEGYRDRVANGNTVLIEYKKDHIDRALSIYPKLNIVQGDIRELPFRNGAFDLIVDLSTIDHIPPKDMPQVVNEYSRVLKCRGKVLLFAWFSEHVGTSDGSWNPDMQFYLQYGRTKEEFEKYFAVTQETTILSRNNPINVPYTPGINIRLVIANPADCLKKCWRKIIGYRYCYLVEFIMEKK